MDRLIRLCRLLDYYGDLLTERQRELLRQYAYEDCSLAEVAEREGISRQGVRDVIVRAEQQLTAYDNALHLIERNERLKKLVIALSQHVAAQPMDDGARGTFMDLITEISAIWEDENGI